MSVFQISVKMLWLNQECRNIFYYDTDTGDPDTAEWQDVCDEIRTQLNAALVNDMSDEWSFYGINVKQVDVPGLNSFDYVPTAGTLVGDISVDDVATQVALLVSVKGFTVKPNRGRTYLCGGVEGNLTKSEWSQDFMDQAVIYINAIRGLNKAGTNGLTRQAVQWNSSHTQVVDNNDIPSESAYASKIPATQRRRRIGVGI